MNNGARWIFTSCNTLVLVYANFVLLFMFNMLVYLSLSITLLIQLSFEWRINWVAHDCTIHYCNVWRVLAGQNNIWNHSHISFALAAQLKVSLLRLLHLLGSTAALWVNWSICSLETLIYKISILMTTIFKSYNNLCYCLL